MVKNPDTLETRMDKEIKPAIAEKDITHDHTERNRSSSPNTASTERTTASLIDRTIRDITCIREDIHVYATGNDSNTPCTEEQNLIDEFQSKYIITW